MRINMFSSIGPKDTGGALPGQVLTTSLFAARDPFLAKELATKGYVDAVLSDLSTANLTGGQFRYEHLALGFDGFSLNTANGTVTLSGSGVQAGTWSKVQVNDKGLISQGGLAGTVTLPDLPWSHVSEGKPDNAAGYGIADALLVSGSSITGSLTLAAPPAEPTHAATKKYVDSRSLSMTVRGQHPGDLLVSLNSATPEGFLRPNGAEVSKSTYPNLYDVIGDTYGFSWTFSGGRPWRQQYQINTAQNASLGTWSNETDLPAALSASQAAVTKDRVYLLGGANSAGVVSAVYRANIASNGILGSWTTEAGFPAPLSHAQLIVTFNRLYVLGGTNADGPVSSVYTATVNSDGSLGSWTSATSLPAALSRFTAIVTRRRVYLLGGSATNSSSVGSVKIYSAPIAASGLIGVWVEETGVLPEAVTSSTIAVTKNRVFLIGGVVDGEYSDKVQVATLDSNGVIGEWSLHSTLPTPASEMQAVVTSGRLYLLGGRTSAGATALVYEAAVNVDGSLGAWSSGTGLPIALRASQAIVTSSKLYILAGTTGAASQHVASCYSCSFSGGVNNYSTYYDGTNQPTDPNNFRLPSLSVPEPAAHYVYLKY